MYVDELSSKREPYFPGNYEWARGWLHEGGAHFSTKDLFSIPRGVVRYLHLVEPSRVEASRPSSLRPLFLSVSLGFSRFPLCPCFAAARAFRENRPRRRKKSCGGDGGWLPVTSFSSHLALAGKPIERRRAPLALFGYTPGRGTEGPRDPGTDQITAAPRDTIARGVDERFYRSRTRDNWLSRVRACSDNLHSPTGRPKYQ